jgi:hypothetical protein
MFARTHRSGSGSSFLSPPADGAACVSDGPSAPSASGMYGLAFSISDWGVGNAPLLGRNWALRGGGALGSSPESDVLVISVTNRRLQPGAR